MAVVPPVKGEGLGAVGVAGKVLKGPSCNVRFEGGRPRNLPVRGLLLEGQAEDTAGPWRRRFLVVPVAEMGVGRSSSSCGWPLKGWAEWGRWIAGEAGMVVWRFTVFVD